MEPSARRLTPAGLAQQLLAEFPLGPPDGVVAQRSQAHGLRGSTVQQVVDRTLNPQPRPPKRRATVDVNSLTTMNLSALPSVRLRVVGSAPSVSDAERRRYGGNSYLLLREPDNRVDANAVAVYGNGHRVGYLSAARAATISPLLAMLDADAFTVRGEGVTDRSMVLWVRVPTAAALRGLG